MSAAVPVGRVGPNAVLQTAAALRAAGGEALASEVFGRAGVADWLAEPPDAMAPQDAVARLHRQLSPEVAADAGRRTAAYLLANRIPAVAGLLLPRLPRRLASRLLLAAIRRNAWTFAGTGRVIVRNGAVPRVEIAGAPLATPGCPWTCAVLEGLFRALVDPRAVVRSVGCCADGDAVCRFELRFDRAARRAH